MPFALILLGFLAFVAAYKDTLGTLGGLLKAEFSGPANFFYWIVALLILGGIGYYRPLNNTSKMLMLLVLVVMILSDKGFFGQFVAALNQTAPAAAPESSVGAPLSDTATSGGSASTSGTISTAEAAASVLVPGSGTALQIGSSIANSLGIPGF